MYNEDIEQTEELPLSHQAVNNPDKYYFTLRLVDCRKVPMQRVTLTLYRKKIASCIIQMTCVVLRSYT